ncbi:hypothetical protein [Marinomonas sp. THO17]|uniref:hypothetical protein n=1 Tax=Marinomonas sp. THO17 TaxID=3149048 RepID=UPI00336C02B0
MRRDDDVEIPSMTLDQDEVTERRAMDATKARPAPSPAKPAHAPTVVHKKQSLLGVYLLLLIVLLVSAGAGYWLWQQNQQLRDELYGAKSEIENLDHQLIAADVSANEQGQTVEQTLKTHDSEIRKLWGVAYDRNRKSIAQNSENVEALKQEIASLKADISTQTKRIAHQDEAFNELEAAYNKLLASVAQLDKDSKTTSDQLKAQQVNLQGQAAQIASAERSLSTQASKDQALTTSLDQLSQNVSNLQQQLKQVENKASSVSNAEIINMQQTLKQQQEAIQSSDAFRSQVNTEIIRLRKQINQLMLEQQLNAQ